MVVVKVRETYDLHTVAGKMTVIGIHTPKPDIIKRNFPGLLMQCKSYRPLSCDVRLACASTMPLDPLGVGLTENDVAPEDAFNPILYKAMSNLGMSQLEARINAMVVSQNAVDVVGQTASVDVDSFTPLGDEFNVYYGLLADAHGWRHANPQSGLEMRDLKPLVYEMLYSVADNVPVQLTQSLGDTHYAAPTPTAGARQTYPAQAIRGNAKPMPFINCTSYSYDPDATGKGEAVAGFPNIYSAEIDVPYIPVVVAGLVIPPSRLHELFFRMVVEWSIEFSSIRPLVEIQNYLGVYALGDMTHYQNYSYSKVKEAVTGDPESILKDDQCMVSSNVDVSKVM